MKAQIGVIFYEDKFKDMGQEYNSVFANRIDNKGRLQFSL